MSFPTRVPLGTTAAALALATTVAAVVAAPARGAEGLDRVSVGPGGVQGDGQSGGPKLSADGRFVAFSSDAANLVPDDSNGRADSFVHDRTTGDTTRVSVGPAGLQSDQPTYDPAISGDGRFVAFATGAALVPGDTNGAGDVFVRNLATGGTERVSVGLGGVQADNHSWGPAISADGRFVAFSSYATNLVPGDTNGRSDVFVRDRTTGRTTRASVGRGGIQGRRASSHPAISADGRFVAFYSAAANLVRGDTNGQPDVFVRDLRAGTTTRASTGPDGAQGDQESFEPAISADGRFVAFRSGAANLVPGDSNGALDVFVHDRTTRKTTRVSVGPGRAQADGHSVSPAISADGRYVAFMSEAGNLVPGDTNGVIDVFLHDRRTGVTRRPSVGRDGTQGNDLSASPALSADARLVAFDSLATNLVPGDTNERVDVFVRTR